MTAAFIVTFVLLVLFIWRAIHLEEQGHRYQEANQYLTKVIDEQVAVSKEQNATIVRLLEEKKRRVMHHTEDK